MSNDRESVTHTLLFDCVQRGGFWLSGDGRIGERDAERILGWAEGSLAKKRELGGGPPYFRLGGARHKVTYRLGELALWIDEQKCDPTITG